jgi:transcriptional regulator with XRE-family HTH domain
VPNRSSSVQQAKQALGDRLREIRVEAGLTARSLAQLSGWHPSKVSKIEHGRTTPTVQDIQVWCEHCGIPDRVTELVASLRAVEGMFIEWRRLERTGLRHAQESVAPLWERTHQFRIYSSFVVPGPVQTAPYIAAVLSAIRTRRGLPDDVAEATAARERRQRVIYEGDHRFAVVLEESVLRSRIGDADTMSGQLGHLLAVSSLPSVSLGVIPADADRSATWPIESFWMFDEQQVAVELVSGYLTITQPFEIGLYARVFAEQAEVAVYGAQARALITAAIAALDA